MQLNQIDIKQMKACVAAPAFLLSGRLICQVMTINLS
jgi:hypothetical protein